MEKSNLIEKTRPRVARACTVCSKKKVRCDGLTPCLNCRNSGADCLYKSPKERKPRVKKADNVCERLTRLENLIGKIASKIEVPIESTSYESPNSISGGKNDGSSDEASADVSPAGGWSHAEKKSEELSPNLNLLPHQTRTGFFAQCKSILKESLAANTKQKTVIHYKGTHLGFSVLGEKSIQYIRERLLPEDYYICVPLQTLPYYFTLWKVAFQSVWSEPQVHTAAEIAKLKEGIFPESKQLMDEILQFYKYVHVASFVLGPDAAQELFDQYYAAQTSLLRRSLSYSELMLMSMVLATSLSLIIDKEALGAYPVGECKLLFEQPISVLVKLQEEMFLNSVYYYHRISAINEGMHSVQALLLMAIYLETSWVVSDVNYTLVSLAIRYAQEMGLHIYDLSAELPVVERVAQLKLWAACQVIDVETCYRLGKPPLLTSDEKSEEAMKIYTDLLQEGCKELASAGGCFNSTDRCIKMVGFSEVFQSLSQLRLVTYHTLFGTSLSFKSVKHVQDIVTTINARSFAFCANVDEAYRPRLYNEPSFDHYLQGMHDGSDVTSNFCMLLSMSYFSHIMTVNRVPWQVVVADTEVLTQESREFRRLSLDSARTILHLVRIVDKKSWPFVTLNWILIFPFLAAMNLCSNCMNRASDKETLKDLSLLIDVSMNFFGFFGNICTEETKLHYMRFQLMDLLLRVLLRVIIKVIEERNNTSILANNKELKKHLESTERNFPHIYKVDQSSLAQFHSELQLRNVFTKHPNFSIHTDILVPQLKQESVPYTPSRPLTLADLLHPEFKAPEVKPREAVFEDDMNYMSYWTQEMLNMPNFFFDNGL